MFHRKTCGEAGNRDLGDRTRSSDLVVEMYFVMLLLRYRGKGKGSVRRG